MRSEEEIAKIRNRIHEIDVIMKPLKEERRVLRKSIAYTEYYDRTYGEVDRSRKHYKTPEQLREYNRIKQREWREKHKKNKQ